MTLGGTEMHICYFSNSQSVHMRNMEAIYQTLIYGNNTAFFWEDKFVHF